MSPDASRGEASRGHHRVVSFLRRWARWGTVGMLGLGVQVTTLLALVRIPGVHYVVATFMAVSGAIVHNFLWHERWTWADRPSLHIGDRVGRFARFTAMTGLTSIVGNVALTATYVEYLQLPLLSANLLAVASISMINFLVAHRLVFFAPGVVSDIGGQR